MSASAWYETWSFWQFAITTLAALMIGALGAFATLRAANPKRRLDFGTGPSVPLLIAAQTGAGTLELTHNGSPVASPRIVELRLRNSGRRDITQSQFHGNDSLRFDFGAQVVGVLGMKSSPAGTIAPSVNLFATRPTVVEIPPSLLARKQVFEVTLLLDGPDAKVRCTAAPLVDVKIRRGPVRSISDLMSVLALLFSGVSVLLAAVFSALA